MAQTSCREFCLLLRNTFLFFGNSELSSAKPPSHEYGRCCRHNSCGWTQERSDLTHRTFSDDIS
jgi:hypothetical protein